ncbi:M28 family peptidase [Leucobacter sp. M11]|uniref:M28 family peptidase n=1 Tax=Leucobacter sp. M11 TaxID=2993565 RepID=UPI002D7EFCC7|nr:M28 family peptidase [Leucobacter sp. M11]MEB4613396.1 M28 family peptidase [Leucobacter sp. M11]
MSHTPAPPHPRSGPTPAPGAPSRRPRPTRRGLLALIAAALIALTAWWALASIAPPRAIPAQANAQEFSAERARVHQADLSQRPHPAGSEEAARVRDMIAAQLRAAGIETRIERGVGSMHDPEYPSAAYTENVVGVIPGTDPTGTVTLVAHYDAAPASLGAGDDGAGVATILETARALASGDPLRNTVVLLFTDAEEVGMLGAEAYVAQDPAGRDGGVVLNIESRGSSGPALMFETSLGNRDLIEVYAQNAPVPVATSLSVELYRLLPNDTDLTPMLASGRFTGLNTSYLDGSAVYHSPEDRIERQSSDSLQHQGTNALGLTRALGDAELAALSVPASGDATYFPMLGQLAHYPQGAVWPIALLAGLGVLAAGAMLVRRRLVRVLPLGAGVVLAVIPLGVALWLGGAVWSALTALTPAFGQLEDTWQPGWFRAGLLLTLLAFVLGWLALARRWVPAEGLFFGGLAWSAGIGVATALMVPGASYAFAIPALLGSLALIARAQWDRGRVAFFVSGALSTAVLVPTVALLLPVSGLGGSGAALLFAALLALSLVPLLDLCFPDPEAPSARAGLRRLVPPVTAAVLAGIAFGVGFSVDRFGPDSPVPVALAQVEDADTGDAFWVSEGADPTGWSERLVTGTADLSGAFPVLDGPERVGPAEPSGSAAPEIEVTAERIVAGDREIDVRFASRIAARSLFLAPASGADGDTAEIRSISLGGREIASGEVPLLQVQALSRGTAELTIRMRGTGPLPLRLIEGADGIAELPGFVPRPSGVIAAEGPNAETRFLARTVTL